VVSDSPVSPFDSLEDTQEFIALLESAIHDSVAEVKLEIERASDEDQARRLEALALALYKLEQLTVHVGKSRRILNDLRTIRRLLSA
jgi:hypothetical protein